MMTRASSTFNLRTAQTHGVGRALHEHPPSIAVSENLQAVADGLILVDIMDLQYISRLDAKLVSSNLLLRALASIDWHTSVDWSHKGFRWWVLIARRERLFSKVLHEGILSVVTSRLRVTITTRVGERFLTVNKGRVKFSPPEDEVPVLQNLRPRFHNDLLA